MDSHHVDKSSGVVCTQPDDPETTISGLIHCARVPDRADGRTPAVVMLHGWGGDEHVMWVFARAVQPQAALFTPRAPLDNGDGGHAWFMFAAPAAARDDSLLEGVAAVRHFVRSLPDLYPVTRAGAVLVGFSQGAAICHSLALAYPDIVLGVAGIAGVAPRAPDDLPRADKLPGLPVFIAHGTRDGAVPVQDARRIRAMYVAKGADVTYGEYDTGHKLNAQGFRDLGVWFRNLLEIG